MSTIPTEAAPQSTFQFLTPEHLSPLVIGTWTTVLLFALEVGLLVQYFSSQKRLPKAYSDTILLKLGVLINALADLGGTAACCAAVYMYTIEDWGNQNVLSDIKWPIYVVVFSTGVVTAVSQLFMIVRYWSLTKHHMVFVFLFFTWLIALAGIFGSGALMIVSPEKVTKLVDLPKILLYVAVVASSVGSGLTTILFFALKKQERSDYLAARSSFIARFFSGMIETGALTTAVTIAGAALEFGKVRETRAYLACAFVVARVYACTMLYILCNRPNPDIHASQPVIITTTETMTSRPISVIPPSLMEDGDTFRITRKRIELHNLRDNKNRHGFIAERRDSDSSSDVSKNLNEELEDMEKSIPQLPKRRETESSASEYEEEQGDGDGAGEADEVSVYHDGFEGHEDGESDEDGRQPLSEDEAGDIGLAIPPVKSAPSAESLGASTADFFTPRQTPKM
ncbi:hypothetical protein HMN09_00109300 [Mycena chlorophos]|uniref:DUF6534 domain-containing protein n=1 Tax=Mycena chlorophos TaxID=658473 RepID=A0A8H6TQB2_MYCCL|nr:hypothetical protein HMN09_00109300 [Mycena chlorophos]